jgi:PAS domain S-box-containing protein
MPSYGLQADAARRLAQLMSERRNTILSHWRAAISRADMTNEANDASPIGIETASDLFSILERNITRGVGVVPNDLDFHVAAVHARRYSIARLFTDIISLQHAFALVLSATNAGPAEYDRSLAMVGNTLNQVAAGILQLTSDLYKQVIEEVPQPICLVSEAGNIAYANPAMCDLLGQHVLGTRIVNYITDADRQSVASSLRSPLAEVPYKTEVEVLRRDQTRIRAALTICRMPGPYPGIDACVLFADNSEIAAREQRFFERFFERLPLAVIRVDHDRRITYVNQATLALLGTAIDNIKEQRLFDLFLPDPAVLEQFQKRDLGEGTLYEAEIVRFSDQKTIPIKVIGTPIVDEQGRVLGSVGIVRNVEIERVAEEMNTFIDAERDALKLLKGIVGRLQRLMPVDYFGVSVLSYTASSPDSDVSSSWFSHFADEPFELDTRWWATSPDQYRRAGIWSFDEYIGITRPASENDPDIRRFRDQGFKWIMRFPIVEGGHVAAALTLMSKHIDSYKRDDEGVIKSLPVDRAIRMALDYRERRILQFRHELLRDMSRCSTAAKVAALLARKLGELFGWHHIAIFQRVESQDIFRLLAEESSRGCLPLANRRQEIDLGVLGRVYRTRTPVNIPDVSADDELPVFVNAWKDIRSVLCLPILLDGEVEWLLDVEDERKSACSKAEQEELERILSEAASVIKTISTHYLLESAFQASSDLVVATDTAGSVVRVNPGAANLLGWEDPSGLVGHFSFMFKDKGDAERVFEASNGEGEELDLVRKDGSTVPALISCFSLPEDLCRKMFVAKDLTVIKRLQELESLRSLFQEVALQTHTPLALATTWLRELRGACEEGVVTEYCTKVLSQLRKAEISYDRLALCVDRDEILEATERQPLDLGVELRRTLQEFPSAEAERIQVVYPNELPYISIDPGQLSFMFGSILAYWCAFPRKKTERMWHSNKGGATSR